MDTDIDISTINKYFSQDICEKDREKQKETPDYRSIIVGKPDFFYSVNEATVCHKLSQISYYPNYFSILHDYKKLTVSKMSEENDENDENNENMDNVLNYYLFMYNDKNAIDFIDHIYSFTSIKKLIFDIIAWFRHLIVSLQILDENDICFFNISPYNIKFLENYREKPVLSNFKLAIRLNKLDFEYFSRILEKLDDFTYQPFEVHLLFYIINHKIESFSYSFIESFSEEFVSNLSILRLFSENYKKIYKEKCIETMKKYTNCSISTIIDDLLDKNDKWDIYGISMLFIQLFGCISLVFSLKGTFISKITLELVKNLHPNSDKRMSLDETLDLFNKLLDEQKDWSFINKLDNNKLERLFDELSR